MSNSGDGGQIVTLQIGQCGNQVGREFFNILYSNLYSSFPKDTNLSDNAFFRLEGSNDNTSRLDAVARAVLIDMEPKVIYSTMQSQYDNYDSEEVCEQKLKNNNIALSQKKKKKLFKLQPSISVPGGYSSSFASSNLVVSNGNYKGSCRRWRYDKNRICIRQSGSANNWAYGYHHHGPEVCEEIRDLVRKEVEKCSSLQGFLLLSSLAGGTGSGLGTFLTESLRDDYRRCSIMNHVVWPYNQGEVIVQNYNAILSLSHLTDCSDGVIITENDTISMICDRLLGIKQPSFSDINSVIASQMAQMLLPSSNFGTVCDEYQPVCLNQRSTRVLSDYLSHLCADPSYKMLTVRNSPIIPERSLEFSDQRWPGLLRHLLQMEISDAKIEERMNWAVNLNDPDVGSFAINRSLASVLLLRGRDAVKATLLNEAHQFASRRMHCPWTSQPLLLCANECSFGRYDRASLVISNSQSIIAPLERVVLKSYGMFCNNAYIHHFSRYGCGVDQFVESFARVEQILEDYRILSSGD